KNGSSKTIGSSASTSAASATSAQSRSPKSAKIGNRMSDLGDLAPAHEAGGADGQDDEDEQEGDAFLEVRVDDAEQLLEQPDHQTADQDADRVLEAAEDRGRKRLDAGRRTHIGPGEGDRRDQDAADP